MSAYEWLMAGLQAVEIIAIFAVAVAIVARKPYDGE